MDTTGFGPLGPCSHARGVALIEGEIGTDLHKQGARPTATRRGARVRT